MQIVIEIPDEVYQDIESRDWKNSIWARDSLMRYIHEGDVLPKGHGRLIDANQKVDKLLYMGYLDEEKSEIEETISRMLTIIPAEEVEG